MLADLLMRKVADVEFALAIEGKLDRVADRDQTEFGSRRDEVLFSRLLALDLGGQFGKRSSGFHLVSPLFVGRRVSRSPTVAT